MTEPTATRGGVCKVPHSLTDRRIRQIGLALMRWQYPTIVQGALCGIVRMGRERVPTCFWNSGSLIQQRALWLLQYPSRPWFHASTDQADRAGPVALSETNHRAVELVWCLYRASDDGACSRFWKVDCAESHAAGPAQCLVSRIDGSGRSVRLRCDWGGPRGAYPRLRKLDLAEGHAP